MSTLFDFWGYCLSVSFVVVYAWERFRFPPTWRSTTTRWRWNLALFGYVAAAVGLWWFLAMLIASNPATAQFIMFGADGVDREIIALSAPYVSALFLTAVLPHMPLLKKLDAAIQTAFRELGAIPKQARRLSGGIRKSEFALPDHLEATVSEELERQGVDAEYVMSAPPHSPAWGWARIVALKTRLCAELDCADEIPNEDEPAAAERVPPFLLHRQAEYRHITAAYRRLAALARLVLPPENGRTGDADSDNGRADTLLITFEGESAELFRDLCHFASCYLLDTRSGVRHAMRTLRGWGFQVSRTRAPALLTWHEVVGLALLVTVYMLVVFLAFGEGASEPLKALRIAASIGTAMAISALCSGLPRRLSRNRARARGAELRFGYYVMSACLAAAAWFLLQYLRAMLESDASIQALIEQRKHIFPFVMIPALATFLIALLVDLDLRRVVGSERRGRVAEGVLLSASLALTGYVVGLTIAKLAPAGNVPPPVDLIMLVQLGLGFILGYVVPHLYRKTDRRTRAEEAAAIGGDIGQAGEPAPPKERITGDRIRADTNRTGPARVGTDRTGLKTEPGTA